MVGKLFHIVSVIVLVVTLVSPSTAALEPTTVEDPAESTAQQSEQKETVENAQTPFLEEDIPSPQPTPSPQLPTEQPPVIVHKEPAQLVAEPETTPPVIITSFRVSQGVDDVEVYNQTDRLIAISSLRFVVSHGNTDCETLFVGEGWLHGRSFFAADLANDCESDGYVTKIEMYLDGTRVQLVAGIPTSGNWWRHKATLSGTCVDRAIPSNMKQTGVIGDFVSCPTPSMACEGNGACKRTSELYVLPKNSENLWIVELMTDSRSCSPSDLSHDCFDFIKVKNVGETSINLAEYRLRTGASTASSTASNTYYWHQPTLHPLRDEYVLEPSKTFTVTKRDNGDWLSLTNGSGNVWIEDYYGVQTYHSASYEGMGLAAARGKSWSYDTTTDTWMFGVPSPYSENKAFVASETPGMGSGESGMPADCGEGRERNPLTNRCRNIPTASMLAPCKDGQYRSEETNRCRSIASAAAATLKPCGDDQFRNPLTNRCKKIASAEELADCGEGRERNPDTNRCRNIANSTVPGVGFAVQPIKDSAMVFAGWWALGGVGLLALGYAGWEWRREMQAWIRRFISSFSVTK